MNASQDETVSAADSQIDCLRIAAELVDELYEYRDKYFIVNGIESGKTKQKNLLAKMKDVVAKLESMVVECEKKNRPLYLMYLGKALNVHNEYDERCFQTLSKAVKLNPKLIEGLNQLGEVYWKKGEINLAINCFENTLKNSPKDKIALRSLSMLLRQQTGTNPKERMENIVKSYQRAKEALDVDVTDGISWYILGNSLFYLYFLSPNQDESKFKQCKFAYSKAITDEKASLQSDFLYNYAHLMEYELNFELALEYLNRASLMDPSWPDPRQRCDSILSYLKELSSMIEHKASLRNRRITKLVGELKLEHENFPGSYKNYQIKSFSSLNVGKNCGCICIGKVIGRVSGEKLLTSSLCLIGCEQSVVAMNVINLNKDKEPRLYQTVAILEPDLCKIDFKHDGTPPLTFSFSILRVDSPFSLIVNGRKLGPESMIRPKVDFSLRND